MKENYFQKRFKKSLESDGFLIFNLSDSFTGGIPDTYVAKDGKSYWFELKVTNKKPGQIIHLNDNESDERGFTREQAIKIYQLKNKGGIEAWGILYLAYDKIAVKIPPEDFERTLKYEELKKEYEEFIL